jgi:hypothetical protein
VNVGQNCDLIELVNCVCVCVSEQSHKLGFRDQTFLHHFSLSLTIVLQSLGPTERSQHLSSQMRPVDVDGELDTKPASSDSCNVGEARRCACATTPSMGIHYTLKEYVCARSGAVGYCISHNTQIETVLIEDAEHALCTGRI